MEICAQLADFAAAFFIGWLLGIIFDCYRMMRGIFRPPQLLTMLLDGMYWLVAVAVAFSCLMLSNWAQLRFYVFGGMIAGGLTYYQLLSRSVLFGLVRSARFLRALVRQLKKCLGFWLIRPLGYCLGIFLYPFRWSGRRLRGLRFWRIRNAWRRKRAKDREEG